MIRSDTRICMMLSHWHGMRFDIREALVPPHKDDRQTLVVELCSRFVHVSISVSIDRGSQWQHAAFGASDSAESSIEM